ncbi:MAG TPA: hypothetical protein VI386_13215 [Candidatus Sulfotelmatobacter sp.]
MSVRDQRAFLAGFLLSALTFTAIQSVQAQTIKAPPAAVDATLYTTYSLFSSDQTLDWIVCGSTQTTSGCYSSGSLGPFGKIGAMLEGNPTTNGSTVTRLIYIVDVAAGSSGNSVNLNVYKKTDTVTTSSDTVAVTLMRTMTLSLTGGLTAQCFMAANPMFLFIGTNQSQSAVRVAKNGLATTQLSVFSGINVSSITTDPYGYVTITWGTSGFGVYNPSGALAEDGGGTDFMLNSTTSVSTTNFPVADRHLSERLHVRPIKNQ